MINGADAGNRFAAISCLSCLFAAEDSAPIQKAINYGFFPSIQNLITTSSHGRLISTALFCLSNLTGGSKNHVHLFLD